MTLFLLSPEDITVPSDKASDLDAPLKTDDPGQTPAEEHSQLMRSSESGILSPTSLCRGGCEMVWACGDKGGNELSDDIGPDVDGEGGEQQRIEKLLAGARDRSRAGKD